MKKILIFHTAFIGDIVLSTPLIKKIKYKYPDSEITYVTTPAGKKILENNPLLPKIISYDKRGKDNGIKGILSLASVLKKEKFDIVYIPHRYLRSSLICFLAKIPKRIGYSISEGKLFLTEKKDYNKDLHEVDRLLNLVDIDNFQDKKIDLYPSQEDYNYIEKIWQDENLEDKKTIALAIGSKWYTKMWPIDYFNELINKLEKLDNIRLIIVGGKDELKLPVKYSEKSINLIDKTSLLQLGALLSKVDILVTNDSSPIHIASAFDTYILAIFGATVQELGFYPWSKNSKVIENNKLDCRPCGLHGGNSCPEKHFKCMLDISVDKVYNEIVKKIEDSKEV
jgi:heptosyltransferase-2